MNGEDVLAEWLAHKINRVLASGEEVEITKEVMLRILAPATIGHHAIRDFGQEWVIDLSLRIDELNAEDVHGW